MNSGKKDKRTRSKSFDSEDDIKFKKLLENFNNMEISDKDKIYLLCEKNMNLERNIEELYKFCSDTNKRLSILEKNIVEKEYQIDSLANDITSLKSDMKESNSSNGYFNIYD